MGLFFVIASKIEEIDTLYPGTENFVTIDGTSFLAINYCVRIQNQQAEVLGTYQKDFYQDEAAIALNHFWECKGIFIGFRSDDSLPSEIYSSLTDELDLK